MSERITKYIGENRTALFEEGSHLYNVHYLSLSPALFQATVTYNLKTAQNQTPKTVANTGFKNR